MADSTQNQILWGFLRYARNNRHNSLTDVHWKEIDDMAVLWCTTNYTDSNDTLTTTDPATYGANQDVPGKGLLADGAGISCTTPSTAVNNQSWYPEQHYGA